jgi:hypothetical protein
MGIMGGNFYPTSNMNVHVLDPTGKPIGEPIEPTGKTTIFEQGIAGGAVRFFPFVPMMERNMNDYYQQVMKNPAMGIMGGNFYPTSDINVHVSDPTGKPIGEPIQPTGKPTTFEQGTAGGAARFLPFDEDFGGEEDKFELALDDDEITTMYVNDIFNQRIAMTDKGIVDSEPITQPTGKPTITQQPTAMFSPTTQDQYQLVNPLQNKFLTPAKATHTSQGYLASISSSDRSRQILHRTLFAIPLSEFNELKEALESSMEEYVDL